MRESFKKITFLIAAVVVSWSGVSFAQADDDGKYLNLSVGVYTDEKIDSAPTKIELDGTFRKLTKVQWNPNTRTMRFSPKAVGVGTLIVKSPASGRVIARFTLDVRKTDLDKVAREIQALLQTIDGISIKILNNKVVIISF